MLVALGVAKANRTALGWRKAVGLLFPKKSGVGNGVNLTSRWKGQVMAKNTICLWYDKDAEAAARFYAGTFPTVR